MALCVESRITSGRNFRHLILGDVKFGDVGVIMSQLICMRNYCFFPAIFCLIYRKAQNRTSLLNPKQSLVEVHSSKLKVF